jgi:hypothetical protein
MADRAASRAKLATILATNTTFVTGYAYESLDFQRQSPVYMVHSDGSTIGPARTLGRQHRRHAFLISLWWKRGTTTEDDMDALSAAVITLIENNSGANDTWDSLELDGAFSQMDYPIVDGVMYRREQIRVIVW